VRDFYILFSTPWKRWLPGAWLIRAIENRKYSHISLLWFDVEQAEWYVLEAYSGGKRLSTQAEFMKRNNVVKRYQVFTPTETFDNAIKEMYSNIGAGYGYWTVLGVLINKTLRLLGIKSGIPFKDGTKTEFCSETVAHFLKLICPEMSPLLSDYEKLTPSQVNDILKVAVYTSLPNKITVFHA
jgi:hypothetical protein